MNKRVLVIGSAIIIILLGIAILLWHPWKANSISTNSSHAWETYKNTKLGFSLEYPSDQMKITERGEAEPDTVTFSFPETPDILVPFPMQIWTYYTNETDIYVWMGKQNRPAYATSTIVGTATVDGQKAVIIGQVKGLLFIDQGRVWSLSVSDKISPDNTKRILDSFHVSPLLGQTNVSQINGSSPLHAQKDSFDGQTYTNSTYGFSFDWNKQMYLSNIDPTATGLVTDTPGALAASGNLAMQTASGVAVITINKFTDLPKTQEIFCEEQIKMNPGTTDCLKSINQAQLLQMKADLLAKKLTADIVQRGDKKDTIPQFIDIKGGVGVLSTLYDMNGGWWAAHFTTLNSENDLIDIYLFRPIAKTPQELASLPEYKIFVDAMKTFDILSK